MIANLRDAAMPHDGRAARSERTRQAVAEALLALLYAGNLRPTAEQIAERAGISVRNVFQHFNDLESLLLAVAELQRRRVAALFEPIAAGGNLQDRIDRLVIQRARLLESIAPVRRAALLVEPFSPEVARRLRRIRTLLRRQVLALFESELAQCPLGHRRQFAAGLAAAGSFSLWEDLRRHQGLSQKQAGAAMKLMFERLLRPDGA